MILHKNHHLSFRNFLESLCKDRKISLSQSWIEDPKSKLLTFIITSHNKTKPNSEYDIRFSARIRVKLFHTRENLKIHSALAGYVVRMLKKGDKISIFFGSPL